MAHELKLHIYQFQVKSRNPKENGANGAMLFEDFFSKKIGGGDEDLSKKELFRRFKESYYESFHGQFYKSRDGRKSFGPILDSLEFDPANNLFYGFLKGGPTGIVQEVYKNSSLEEEGEPLDKDKVVSLKYFFFIWLPYDANYGIIMLQSYSSVSTGLGGPFFDHLEDFLDGFNLRSRKSIKVPEYIKKEFKKKSVVLGFDLIKNKVSPKKRSEFNPNLAHAEQMKVTLSFSNLSYSVSEFERLFSFRNNVIPLNINLESVGFDDPSEYKVKINYRDTATGKKAHTYVSNHHGIMPSILLDNEIKEEGKEVPKFSRILKKCKKELLILQEELEYLVKD